MGFHVDSWINSRAFEKMQIGLHRGENPSTTARITAMETWYYQQAVDIYRETVPMMQRWIATYLNIPYRMLGFAPWNIMSQNRHVASPGSLWYNSDFPEDYYGLAVSIGMADTTLDDFRWTGGRGHAAPLDLPKALHGVPAFGLTRQAFASQCEEIANGGFVDAGTLPEYSRMVERGINLSSLTGKAIQARITKRMDRTTFDAFRLVRTLTKAIFPYAASRSLWDTVNVSAVGRKDSIKEAIATSRDENLAKYVCMKASERDGLLLTIGASPIGLVRYAAQIYGPRLRILGLMESVDDAGIHAASGRINGWDNFAMYCPDRQSSWAQLVNRPPAFSHVRVSLMYIQVSDNAEQLLESFGPLIARDKPQVIIKTPDRPNAGSYARLLDKLKELDYSCAILGREGNFFGYFSPIDPQHPVSREAIYAWSVEQTSQTEDLTGATHE